MAFYKAIKIPIFMKPATFPGWYDNPITHYVIQDTARASRVEATMLEFAVPAKKATKQYKLRVIGV